MTLQGYRISELEMWINQNESFYYQLNKSLIKFYSLANS